jgi:hypothetical protein
MRAVYCQWFDTIAEARAVSTPKTIRRKDFTVWEHVMDIVTTGSTYSVFLQPGELQQLCVQKHAVAIIVAHNAGYGFDRHGCWHLQNVAKRDALLIRGLLSGSSDFANDGNFNCSFPQGLKTSTPQ